MENFVEENARLIWSLVPTCEAGTITNDALLFFPIRHVLIIREYLSGVL